MTELWYRFNLFAEKKFFTKNLVDCLIVPAHLVAYYEIAMPEFLREIDMPFLIDPVTYVWGIDKRFISKEGRLKKSYTKFIERLDCSIASMLGTQPIQRTQKNSLEFQKFTEKILRFQLLEEDLKKPPRRRSIERIKRYREKNEVKSTQWERNG